MPELPEVETVRRGLAPYLTGVRVAGVEQRRADLRFPLPDRFGERLAGRVVTSLERRAKYLLAHLSDGHVLAMHLGMSGRFTVTRADTGDTHPLALFRYETGGHPAHDHIVFVLETGTRITYNDPRRFGYMALIAQSDLAGHKLFRDLGVEPTGTDLTATYLARRARGRTAGLKAFLMDQRIVAGLGNIYVCEALHRAGLKPSRRAAALSTATGRPTARAERLVMAIRETIAEAIDAGGSTLRDYAQADGRPGAFQNAFQVYDRAGAPCLRVGCRGAIRRTVSAGRATYACTACQR